MKNIVIFGASSAIAEATARLWSKENCNFYLVGRRKDKLESISKNLKAYGSGKIFIKIADLSQLELHSSLIESAKKVFPTIDIVFIAHGVLPDQSSCERSVTETLKDIETNALSYVSLLNILANDFEKQSKGTIVVMSSVAGDRGRKSNYVYGSSKSMVSTFCSGLMHRFHGSNVCVLTVKPGLIDTPMTDKFKKGILWAHTSIVAKNIVRAVRKQKNIVYTPPFWSVVMQIIKLLPNAVFKRINF